MQPILLTTQLIDGTGTQLVRLVFVPIGRGEVVRGPINISLSLAHTGAVLGLVIPPSDSDLPPGCLVSTTWGNLVTPHIARWTPQNSKDTWETIMACSTFTAFTSNGLGKGLFQAQIWAGLTSSDSEMGEVEALGIEQWASPDGRLAWLVALAAHLPTPAAADLRIKGAIEALRADPACADLRPELMDRGAHLCADRLGIIMDEWARWTGRQQLREREPAAAAADVVMRLIELMEQLGEHGKKMGSLSRNVLKKGRADEMMLRRADDVSFDAPLMTSLILALWHDEIKVRLTMQPALIRAVVAESLAPIRAGKRAGEVKFLDDGSAHDGHRVIARAVPQLDARAVPTLDARVAGESLHLLGRVAGHRLLNHLVRTGWKQWDEMRRDPRCIEFDGAYDAIRDIVKIDDTKELKRILDIGRSFSFESESIEIGGLWTYTHTKSAPGRRAQIKVVLGAALMPCFGDQHKSSSDMITRQARYLIPLLDHEPPLEGLRRNDQGAALNLSQLALVELRDAAVDLKRNATIRTPISRWRELARRSGLPLDALETLLAKWEHPGERETAFIERYGDEWTLASAHAIQLEFIKEAGGMMEGGRKSGRDGKRKKARHGDGAHSGRLT